MAVNLCCNCNPCSIGVALSSSPCRLRIPISEDTFPIILKVLSKLECESQNWEPTYMTKSDLQKQ